MRLTDTVIYKNNKDLLYNTITYNGKESEKRSELLCCTLEIQYCKSTVLQ